MHSEGLEPVIPAIKRLKTYALYCTAILVCHCLG